MAMPFPGSDLINTSLTQIYGEHLNKTFLLEGDQVIIGRSSKANIRLKHNKVSQEHCILTHSEDGWSITDNYSQVGTFINGQQLFPAERKILLCGDIVFLGPSNVASQAFRVDVDYKSPESQTAINFESPLIVRVDSVPCTNEQVIDLVIEKEINKNSEAYSSVPVITKRKSPLASEHSNSSKTSFKKAKITVDMEPDKSITNQDNQVEDSPNWLDIITSADNDEFFISDDIDAPSCSYNVPSVKEKPEYKRLKSQLASVSQELKKCNQEKDNILKERELILQDINKENNILIEQLMKEQENLRQELENYKFIACDQEKMKDELHHKAKSEIKKELLDNIGEDLMCIICSELLSKPSVLDCAHTFCEYCIKMWMKKKNECPICRKRIKTVLRILSLDNFIEKIILTLTPEQKDIREKLLKERQELLDKQKVDQQRSRPLHNLGNQNQINFNMAPSTSNLYSIQRSQTVIQNPHEHLLDTQPSGPVTSAWSNYTFGHASRNLINQMTSHPTIYLNNSPVPSTTTTQSNYGVSNQSNYVSIPTGRNTQVTARSTSARNLNTLLLSEFAQAQANFSTLLLDPISMNSPPSTSNQVEPPIDLTESGTDINNHQSLIRELEFL